MVPFGTGNRCVMLRQGYIELIAIVDPAAFSNTLDRFLARYAGIHIIALGIDDEAANLDRLRRAGIDIPGVAYLERPVDDADPAGARARFARLPLPDAPEGRLQLSATSPRRRSGRSGFLTHPNHAVALEEVVIAVEQPAEAAARFSRLAGRPVVPDPAGGYALPMPHGTVRLLPPDALGTVFPNAVIPTLPFVAGIVVRSDDLGATARLLAEARPASSRRDRPAGRRGSRPGAALQLRAHETRRRERRTTCAPLRSLPCCWAPPWPPSPLARRACRRRRCWEWNRPRRR